MEVGASVLTNGSHVSNNVCNYFVSLHNPPLHVDK